MRLAGEIPLGDLELGRKAIEGVLALGVGAREGEDGVAGDSGEDHCGGREGSQRAQGVKRSRNVLSSSGGVTSSMAMGEKKSASAQHDTDITGLTSVLILEHNEQVHCADLSKSVLLAVEPQNLLVAESSSLLLRNDSSGVVRSELEASGSSCTSRSSKRVSGGIEGGEEEREDKPGHARTSEVVARSLTGLNPVE